MHLSGRAEKLRQKVEKGKKTSSDLYFQEKRFKKWEENLVPVWNGSEKISFSYNGSKGREKRTVSLTTVLLDIKGPIVLFGKCHARNEDRSFILDRILTTISLHHKKYEKESFLQDALGVTEEQLQATKNAHKEARDKKSKVYRDSLAKRFTSIWQGDKNIFFYFRKIIKVYGGEEIEKERIHLRLIEVLRSKKGDIYFYGDFDGDYNVYSTSDLASRIFYNRTPLPLYTFLIDFLGISPKEIGISFMWTGKNVLKITSNYFDLKKELCTLTAIIKDKFNTIFFVCQKDNKELSSYIPWDEVQSIYIDEKRLAPRTYLEKRLGLTIPKEDE